MTQETATKLGAEVSLREESKRVEKKQVTAQELIESLKSTADDIGQISELSSEEKILIAQLFASLLKLMRPLASSINVSTSALPVNLGLVTQAHIDPTGHIALLYEDGHLELENLSEEKNRDLMMSVVGDIVPKFKNLTSAQKRKIENRIKFLTSITKEIQKNSDALAAVMSNPSQ